MDIASISKIFLILINIIGFVLAIWVYSADKKKKANMFFFLMIISMVVWTDFNYAGDMVASHQLALLLKKIYFALVSLFFIFSYFFTIHFPVISKRNIIFFEKPTVFIWSLNALLILFTDVIIKDVERKQWGFDMVPGAGINIFYALVVFYIFLFLYELVKKYFYLSLHDRRKVLYFIVGLTIYAVFQIIFNVLSPIILKTKQYWQFGDYSAIFLFVLTGYAVIKREMFGIKVVLTEILVGTVGLVLVIVPFLEDVLWFRILNFAIFFFFCIVGYLLITSTLREERRKEALEKMVEERTKKLQDADEEIKKRKADLDKFYKLTVGRELRMIELKGENKKLKDRLN